MRLHTFLIEWGVYPAMELFKGNRIRKKLRELKKSELDTPEQRSAQTKQSLTDLLTHCAQNVPVYADAAFSPTQLQETPDVCLRCIPPLTKERFRANADRYLAQDIPANRQIQNCTSGSTGVPLHFSMTREQVEWYEAARWRALSWYGITPGSRSVMIWGQPIDTDKLMQKKQALKEHFLKNRWVFSAYMLSEADALRYVALLNRYRPEYLYGYASALAELARILQPYRAQLKLRLKVVVSTAEQLLKEQESLISQVFLCPIADEYGARDAGILAYRCPEGSLHIAEENVLLEVLDPLTLEPLSSGQTGLLAVTDLHNTVQPRLRYLLGDVGARAAQPCRCGRSSALLQCLEGREDALLVRKNGELVNGNLISHIVRENPGILQFRFVQHSVAHATLYVVKSSCVLAVEKELRLIEQALPGLKVKCEVVPAIAPRASGKLCSVLREFPLPQNNKHTNIRHKATYVQRSVR